MSSNFQASMSKEHAQHNEEACDHLLSTKNGKGVRFNDWIVTTAFYSAMHYVQHEIFPLQLGDKNYRSFNDYYQRHFPGRDKPNKHTATADLVRIHIYLAYTNYKSLVDACHSARYSDYDVSDTMAERCRERLTVIKDHLKK